jgi:hypothetical protein
MKDTIETRIIDSKPHGRGNKEFVTRTLRAIQLAKSSETFGKALRTTKANQKKNPFMKFIKIHRGLAIIVAIVIVSSLSFTGYAYASGSNPVDLIRNLLNGGKTVEVKYKGRTFQYGSSQAYSDAAITAYAELNTIGDLHFRASNAFQIPKDDIEHVSDPYNTKYVYPWVGTVESLSAQTVRVHKQYLVGDKAEPSRQLDEHIDLPKKRLSPYRQGEVVDPDAFNPGSMVIVYQDAYLEHRIGSSSKPTSMTQYFAFGLTHDLASIQEVSQSTKFVEGDENRKIYEPSWGNASNICSNNGADQCDADKQGSPNGDSLYVSYGNPHVIPFGEGAPDSSRVPKDLIGRTTQGKITNITNKSITIKSSSGRYWIFDFDTTMQQSFSKSYKALSIGDKLVVTVFASVNNLDNRHFDNQHIYTMQRYN